MGLLKNTAGQRWRVFAFNRTTNAPVTGDAANITAKIRLDWGTATATDDTNPTEVEDGYYDFVLTQAESNANWLDLFPESSTDDVQVIGVPGSMATRAGDAYASLVIARGKVTDATTPTGSNFSTDLTTLGTGLNDAPIRFVTGDRRFEAPKPIAIMVAGEVTLDEAFSQSPAVDDEFEILAQHVHAMDDLRVEIADAVWNFGTRTLTSISALGLATASKLLKYVQLLARKDAAIATDNATELGEINADGGSGAGAFSNETDAQEAIRDRGDAAWTTGAGGGGGGDDAATIYAYFTDGTRADAFKADVSGLALTGEAAAAAADVIAHGDGSWVTATGFSTFNPATDTVANVTAVGSVSGNVGGIAGTITTLDALDTAQDSQHAATKAVADAIKARTDQAPIKGETIRHRNVDTNEQADVEITAP